MLPLDYLDEISTLVRDFLPRVVDNIGLHYIFFKTY